MMDSSNLGPVKAEPTMDSSTTDWKTQLQPDSRQKIVNKIMGTLKKHLPISDAKGPDEVNRIAVSFEEKIYSSATSETEYLREISKRMLTLEKNSTGNAHSILFPTAEQPMPGQQHAQQQQPQNLLQHMHRRQQQRQMLKQKLQIPSSLVPSHIQQQLQQNLLQSSQIQPSQQSHHQSRQSTLQRTQPPAMQSSSHSNSAIGQTSVDPITGQVTGDWQEEVCQKIRTMKELYLPDLSELHQKISMKCQEHDSLPQPPKSDQMEKLKVFKTMLELMMQLLNLSTWFEGEAGSV